MTTTTTPTVLYDDDVDDLGPKSEVILRFKPGDMEDRAEEYSWALVFHPQPPLENETRAISITTSKASSCNKRQTTHGDTYLNVLFCRGRFVFLGLVSDSAAKFHLVKKCKCCEDTRTSSEGEQWPEASGGAGSAFEPFRAALMCNL